MWHEYIGVDERNKHITQWNTVCHSDQIARMGGRPWDVLIYSLESDSSSAASCRVSSSCSQSSRVAGYRLAVDKLRATTPAFRARDAWATICCGRLAQGRPRGAYGTYIGPDTSWTTGATGAGTGAGRSWIITLRRDSWITTCRCCLANSCWITRATCLSSIAERLSSLLSSLLRRRGMRITETRGKY